MSAQEREALAEALAREEWPDLSWPYIREHSDPERFYRRADALLAAGWTRPVPDGDAIERAALDRAAMEVLQCDVRPACDNTCTFACDGNHDQRECYEHEDPERIPFTGDVCWFAESVVDAILAAANLLASPVREPGRKSLTERARERGIEPDATEFDTITGRRIADEPGRSEGETEYLTSETEYGVRYGDGEVDEMADLEDAQQFIKNTREHIADDIVEAQHYEPMTIVERTASITLLTDWKEVDRHELDHDRD